MTWTDRYEYEEDARREAELALSVVNAWESDDLGGNSELKALNRLAQYQPTETIQLVIDDYKEFVDDDTFPYSELGIPADGLEHKARGDIVDCRPSEEFKANFRMGDVDGCVREVLVALGYIGLRPTSTEWVEGAVARMLDIPRLGRRGEWGRGWLFANSFRGWEGAKCIVGAMNLSDYVMSPSEWRWVIQSGLAPGRFCRHVGDHNWNWEALNES